MEVSLFSAEVILEQLNKCLRYYISDDYNIQKIQSTFSGMDDDTDMIKLAKKYEKETDVFIHSIAEKMIDETNDRKNILKIVREEKPEIIRTFLIRYAIISKFFEDNPNKEYPISESVPQFFIDCLINYWKEYIHDGAVNFLRS